MRWVFFAILAYAALLVQTTLGNMVAFKAAAGWVCPDFAGAIAVFFAMRVRHLLDAVIAGWVLGIGMDLAGAGGVGAGAIGPMAISYALAAWLVFAARDAFFRDRPLTQALLTAIFCAAAHLLWVTLQSLLDWGRTGWGDWGRYLLQALLLAAYTALLAPLVQAFLGRISGWFIAPAAARWRSAGR